MAPEGWLNQPADEAVPEQMWEASSHAAGGNGELSRHEIQQEGDTLTEHAPTLDTDANLFERSEKPVVVEHATSSPITPMRLVTV